MIDLRQLALDTSPKKTVCLRLSKQAIDAIEMIASAEGISRPDFVRAAIDTALKTYAKKHT